MKFIKLLFPVLLILMLSCNSNNSLELEKSVYSKALKVNDYVTAIGAANRIVLLNPEEKYYNDSIAYIHFQMNNNQSAFKVAKQILDDHSNKDLFTILAKSSSKLSVFEESNKYFSKLAKIDTANNYYYYFEIGANYYSLNKMDSAFSYMKKVMNLPQSKLKQRKITTNNKKDDTFYYVAALHTIGVVYLNLKNYEKAEEIFLEVNKLDPKFQLVKQNYNILQSIVKSTEK